MHEPGSAVRIVGWCAAEIDFAPADAAAVCNTGGDGVESAPQAVAAGGWWTDVLCAHGHAAWSGFTAQAGRTATVEVTALDESGLATTAKAMPLIGVWGATRCDGNAAYGGGDSFGVQYGDAGDDCGGRGD